MERLDLLIEKYLDGTLSLEEREELASLLGAQTTHRDAFFEALHSLRRVHASSAKFLGVIPAECACSDTPTIRQEVAVCQFTGEDHRVADRQYQNRDESDLAGCAGKKPNCGDWFKAGPIPQRPVADHEAFVTESLEPCAFVDKPRSVREARSEST